MKIKKVNKIILNILPIVLMILLIPLIKNDYILSGVYFGIIILSLLIKREKKDIFFFVFGFVALTISEYLFVSTGVETFIRNSLFNIMPLWLPILWGYVFIAMKRTINIINSK